MAMPGNLVSTEWLAGELDAPDLVVLDASVFLHMNPEGQGYTPESGRTRFEAGHLPGARFVDLIAELSAVDDPVPFTMPSPARFCELVGGHGVGDDSRVVVYATGSPMWATRLWWMLRSVGFERCAVLDGGYAKWVREGRPTSTATAPARPATLTPRPHRGLWATRDEVLAAIGDPTVCTINALSPAVYSGERNTYGRAGHIPGSVNVFYDTLLDPQEGTFLPPARLRALFDAVGAFERPRAICYCGGGISATMDALALRQAGHRDVAVYDGSMWEWVGDPALPLTLGHAP
jgi:thiosulfate/3-mercaptopyruvate sulfurtransferase